jgi:hypothetical protein
MKTVFRAHALAASAVLLFIATSSSLAAEMGLELKLSGDQEVPPVSTAATGAGTIKVGDDGSVSGSVSTKGIDGTMAHIHIAAAGKNGPVIVPLVKTADGVWSVQPGAKLTPDQLKAFKAGELYVNVHSAANKGGEIRAQLKP